MNMLLQSPPAVTEAAQIESIEIKSEGGGLQVGTLGVGVEQNRIMLFFYVQILYRMPQPAPTLSQTFKCQSYTNFVRSRLDPTNAVALHPQTCHSNRQTHHPILQLLGQQI